MVRGLVLQHGAQHCKLEVVTVDGMSYCFDDIAFCASPTMHMVRIGSLIIYLNELDK